MKAKDAGLVGLSLIGILVALGGVYLGYLWLGSGALLLLIGGLIAIVAGITMTIVGFNAD